MSKNNKKLEKIEQEILGGQQFLTDYETYIRAADPDFKLIGRDEEIEQISNILVQKDAHNVLLTGPAGVGRSAIIKGLTERKSSDDMPLDILSRRFMRLDVNAVFAADDVNDIIKNFDSVIDELKKSGNRVLVIDDFKDFMDGVQAYNCPSLINKLMLALRNKEFQTICVFRDAHLNSVLDMHSDVKELFTINEVEEPSEAETIEIIKGTKSLFEEHHGMKISDAALEEAVDLTNRYRSKSMHRAQPARALRLVDSAASELHLEASSKSPEIAALEEKLEALSAKEDSMAPQEYAGEKELLEQQMEEATGAWRTRQSKIMANIDRQRQLELELAELKINLAKQQDADKKAAEAERPEISEEEEAPKPKKSMLSSFSKAGQNAYMVAAAKEFIGSSEDFHESKKAKELQSDIRVYERELDKLREDFESLSTVKSDVTLSVEDIKATFSNQSGIPMKKLNQNEKERLLKAEEILGNRVFGQDYAIESLSEAVRTAKAGLKDPNKPIGSFLFLGPSGVGKTELAKALAEFLYEDEKALTRFDMSEFGEKHTVAKLIGAPPGYSGYEEGGALTNALMANPDRVILFDEVEKADPKIFDILLQVIDDGRLTDGQGKTVDFSNTVVIMTSNIGAKNFLDESTPFEEASKRAKDELYSFFRPEFLNRFTDVVGFNRLAPEHVQRVAMREIDKKNKQLEGHNIEIALSDEDALNMVKDHYIPKEGARGIQRLVTKEITSKTARIILSSDAEHGGRIDVDYDPIEKGVTLSMVPYEEAPAPEAEENAAPVNAQHRTFKPA